MLIGLKQPYPELFDNIHWGTERVLEHTRTRIKNYSLRYYALEKQWDLDTPEDLARCRALTPGK